MGTNTTEIITTEQSPVETPRRKRRRAIRGPDIQHPTVRRGEIDDEPVVFVQLSGKGHWREMILDAERWPMVVEQWGPTWVLMPDGWGNAYPASGRAAVGPLARTKGPAPVALLARLLTNAGKDQVVRFGNGDSLDLRSSNLLVMSRDEARRWAPGMAAFLDHLTVAS